MASSSYTLHGDIGSGSAVVELMLAEVGAEVELVDVPLARNSQQATEYLSLNPRGKLPTLVTPDGDVLTESAAIVLWLAERFPAARLLPQPGTGERGFALRWLVVVATELYPLIEIIDYPERFLPESERRQRALGEALRDRARDIWKQRWLTVEANVAGDPWFLESGFSAMDLYIGVVSRWAQLERWRQGALPKIERIARAVAERPSCAGVWSRHFAG